MSGTTSIFQYKLRAIGLKPDLLGNIAKCAERTQFESGGRNYANCFEKLGLQRHIKTNWDLTTWPELRTNPIAALTILDRPSSWLETSGRNRGGGQRPAPNNTAARAGGEEVGYLRSQSRRRQRPARPIRASREGPAASNRNRVRCFSAMAKACATCHRKLPQSIARVVLLGKERRCVVVMRGRERGAGLDAFSGLAWPGDTPELAA